MNLGTLNFGIDFGSDFRPTTPPPWGQSVTPPPPLPMTLIRHSVNFTWVQFPWFQYRRGHGLTPGGQLVYDRARQRSAVFISEHIIYFSRLFTSKKRISTKSKMVHEMDQYFADFNDLKNWDSGLFNDTKIIKIHEMLHPFKDHFGFAESPFLGNK